jgi:hypothetical protein
LVYPNPFVPGDVLLVESGAGLAASSSVLDVFDALGRKVVEGLRPAPEMGGGWRISTRNWAAGNYRLVIRSTEGSETLGVVCIE